MKLLLHLVLVFTLLISLFLLLCEVLLNQFTGAQVWEELVFLGNCLSCPLQDLLSEHCSWWVWLPHTAWDEARRPHSFNSQIQTHGMSEISPFTEKGEFLSTALLVQHCSRPQCRLDVLSPTTGLLTRISTGSTESLSKQKVMKQVRTKEDADFEKPCS